MPAHKDALDQWGVELDKVLARRIVPELSGTAPMLAHVVMGTKRAKFNEWSVVVRFFKRERDMLLG